MAFVFPTPRIFPPNPPRTCSDCSLPTHTERGITFETQPYSFYRPASRLIRDLSVLALCTLPSQAADRPPYTVLDACSASGIRSLRYLHPPCPVAHVTANDTHSLSAHRTLVKNLHPFILNARVTVSNMRAEELLKKQRATLVDLDMFGTTGEPVVGLAVDAVQRNGLLYLCATDSVAGSGGNAKVAYAAYGAATIRMPAANEQFLRLVMGAVVRAAMARGRSVNPVFSFFHRVSSTARVMMQLDHGGDGLRNVGFVRYCSNCAEIAVGGLEDIGSVALCGSCGRIGKVCGPLWVGDLHNKGFLKGMTEVAQELHQRGDDWRGVIGVLERLRRECGMKPMYYPVGEVGKRIGRSVPPTELIREDLKAMGGDCAPAHASPRCLKVTRGVGMEQLVLAAKKAASRVNQGTKR